MVHVELLKNINQKCVDDINALLPQLTSKSIEFTADKLQYIIEQPHTQVFRAIEDDTTIGILVLSWYYSVCGVKFWIEDFVVDAKFRRQGIGRTLVQNAISFAKSINSEGSVMLTSKPSRLEAHRLYADIGFDKYDTCVFKMK